MEQLSEFAMSAQLHVLLIDDDRVMRMMFEQQLSSFGCTVTTATNGQEGLGKLLQDDETIDIVMIDREMPKMDGVEFVEKMRNFDGLAQTPVIMISGTDQADKIQAAADVGVYYYMVKPLKEEELLRVLRIVVDNCQLRKKFKSQISSYKAPYAFFQSATFYISKPHEAENLALFISGFYEDPNYVVNGLYQLFINAVEHGNLGIGFDDKSEIDSADSWRKEINRRAKLRENADKKVEIVLRRNKDGLYCRIADEGKGFDWKAFQSYDAVHVFKRNGRGIIGAINVFGQIKYNTAGNVVTAIMRDK